MENDTRNKVMVISVLAIALLTVLIVFCVLCPIGICPEWCQDAGGGDEPDNTTNDTCVPRDDKMRAEVPLIMDAMKYVFNVDNDTDTVYLEDDYNVGVIDYMGRIDCQGLSTSNQPVPALGNKTISDLYMDFKYACLRTDGEFLCTPTVFLCYCPGDNEFPAWECAYTDEGHGLTCDGKCPSGTLCKEVQGECVCETHDEDPQDTCHMGQDLQCAGDCPPGEFCRPNIPMTDCFCNTIPI